MAKKNDLSSMLTSSMVNADKNLEKSPPKAESKKEKKESAAVKKEEPQRVVFKSPRMKRQKEENVSSLGEAVGTPVEEIHDEEAEEKKYRRRIRILNGILVALCVYVVFLICGVFTTDYQYEDDGLIHPQVLTVSDVKEKYEFEVILGQYEKCRALYEKVLVLDYRIAKGVEDQAVIAPDYEALLEDSSDVNVTDLSVKTDALEVNARYATLKDMLLNWIQNDIAIYLQDMSTAISQNDSEAASEAIIYKDTVYNDFLTITQNIVSIGSEIKGVDLTDVKEWTPEGYIEEEIGDIS